MASVEELWSAVPEHENRGDPGKELRSPDNPPDAWPIVSCGQPRTVEGTNIGGAVDDGPLTLADLLLRRGSEEAGRVGFTFLSYRCDETPRSDDLTYGDLLTSALAVASQLQNLCDKGDRVLIVCPPGLDYIAAFFGCQLSGLVAVPAYPPRNAKHMGRLETILSDAGAAAILAPADIASRLVCWAGGEGKLPPILATDQLDTASSDFVHPPIDPDDLAFLQYTSGTTGQPKGVMISHRQVVHNLTAIQHLVAANADDVGVSWLPPYHDLGLIGSILYPLSASFRAVLMSPACFLQSPIRWLRALSDYRAALTTSPNFGWQLCVDMIGDEALGSLDLSALRHAQSGAEMVRPETLHAFSSRFGRYGFRAASFVPVYGMAETVLLSTGTVRSGPPRALVLEPDALSAGRLRVVSHFDIDRSLTHGRLQGRLSVSCGKVIDSNRLRIVDPQTGRECPESSVGEIWISGPTVAAGYWNSPDKTEKTFKATIDDHPRSEPWLRTGDLGALIDGELHILGRTKDVIIVRGRNLYAQDLEKTFEEAVPALGQNRTIAFGTENDGDERVVAIHELTRSLMRKLEAPCLASSMRRALLAEHGVDVEEIVFVKPAHLPRTTSGKHQRSKARDLYLNEELSVVARWKVGERHQTETISDIAADRFDRESPEPSRCVCIGVSQTEEFGDDDAGQSRVELLLSLIADLMDRPHWEIKPASRLLDLGLDSLHATRLIGRISEVTGRHLEIEAVFEAGTIAGLAELLGGVRSHKDRWAPIRPANRSNPVPMSFQQERLWFLDRFYAGDAYHIGGALALSGQLDIPALANALKCVVDRHESLRTLFAEGHDLPRQIVQTTDACGFELVEENASDWSEEQLKKRASELLAEPFDLSRGRLFRSTLLRVQEDQHVLVIGGHHAVLDGWSVRLLLQEVSEQYQAGRTGNRLSLPPMPIQYADYAVWQRAMWSGEWLETETEWWLAELSDGPEAISLPFDRPRPPELDYSGQSVPVHIPSELVNQLKHLAKSEDVTLFMLLEAVFVVLLHRLGGDDDLVIGTAVAGRPRTELEGLVGVFVNSVALRHRIDGLTPFRDHLSASKRVTLRAFEHSLVPFEAIVEAVRPSRNFNQTPLVQVMFVLQNQGEGSLEQALSLKDVKTSTLATPGQNIQFELSMNLAETTEGLSGTVDFSSQLFNRETIDRVVAMYRRLLDGVVAAPDTCVADLPLMEAAERDLVIASFNETDTICPGDQTVIDLFCKRAFLEPDAIAIVEGDNQIRYGELDTSSNRVARYLIGLGVGPESVVGVCLERSADLIITLLGIWKAGGGYLPLDPEYPAERLGFMLSDAGARLVVTNTALADDETGLFQQVQSPDFVLIDDGNTRAAIATQVDTRVSCVDRDKAHHRGGLAYVTYTSGSTGRPKGVVVGHQNLAHYAAFAEAAFSQQKRQVVLHRTTLGFDYSAEELWWTLAHGHRLVVAPAGLDSDPTGLSGLADCAGVTTMVVVPSLLAAMVAEKALPRSTGFGQILCGGEAMSSALLGAVRSQKPHVRIVNHYGPTEATINATFLDCEAHEAPIVESCVSIGSPVANTQIYIMGPHFAVQPIGVFGELAIGGVQVSRGYLGRPGLTADRFVADPYSDVPGARLYRTGDLARWRSDGTIEFRGRIDNQVKVRGMRVELGEIEAALAGVTGIAQSAVKAITDESGVVQLVAYLVPGVVTDELLARSLDVAVEELTDAHRSQQIVVPLRGIIDLAAMRAELARCLPEHMIPSGFVGLTQLPLTASGKINHKALPETDIHVVKTAHVAPRDATEQIVCHLMHELIAHDRIDLGRVGIDDRFFNIGGHSILAAQMAGRLEKVLGHSVPVRWIFEEQTARGLAKRIRNFDATGNQFPQVVPADRSRPIPASLEQERMWLLNKIYGDRPVHNEGLTLFFRGCPNGDALLEAVQGILDRYEVLRTRLAWSDNGLYQEISPPGCLGVRFEDWSGSRKSIAEREAEAEARARCLIEAPYDLEVDFPCRALVIKLSDQAYVWCLAVHHVAEDNWSLNHVLPADFVELYDAHCEGRRADLPEIRLNYADYAAWQRSEQIQAIRLAELDYWRVKLEGLPQELDLPTDRPRPAIREHAGANVELVLLSSEKWRAVEVFSTENNTTPFVVFIAALSALLHRVTGSNDIVIGTPHLSKPDAELWPEFGYFGNTIALRNSVDGPQPFHELLHDVRQTVLEALRHQAVGFEEIVQSLGLATGNAAPVFQVMLVMHAFADKKLLEHHDLQVGIRGYQSPIAKHDICFKVSPGTDGVRMSIQFATDIFDTGTVWRLGQMFGRVLEAVLTSSMSPIEDIQLLGEAELHRKVGSFK